MENDKKVTAIGLLGYYMNQCNEEDAKALARAAIIIYELPGETASVME
ncbi:hypothetical protein AB4114_11225 [Paenibacillus sp. 2RAB27]